LGEYTELLSSIIFQVVEVDRWVWKLHSSYRYIVSSAYHNLINEVNPVSNEFYSLNYNHL